MMLPDDDGLRVNAALDVVDYLFNSSNPSADDPDRTWLIDLREGRPRKHRASWAGFIPRSTLLKWRARSRLETKRIDGKMRVEKGEQPEVRHIYEAAREIIEAQLRPHPRG